MIETVIAVQGSSLDAPAAVKQSFGSPEVIGRLFLTDNLLTFEVISLVLIVGAIAGVALGAGNLLQGVKQPRPRTPKRTSPDLLRLREDYVEEHPALQSAPVPKTWGRPKDDEQ